jgi:cell division protein FtsA
MRHNGKHAKTRSGLIAALDVGTTKICCFIAKPVEPGRFRIVGIGHHGSKGLRAGAIVDMEAAEASLRATVELAEQMAGGNIRGAVVNLSAGNIRSELVAYDVSIAGHQVGDADLRRILDPAEVPRPHAPDHQRVHAIPVGYSIDGNRGVRDPRGLFGELLGVNMHVITAAGGAVRNLATAVNRCHLDLDRMVVTPFASALACLVDDEMQLGATLIDIGGGTTSIAVFFDGELIFADVVPLGGAHVTADVARGLSTPLAFAERMKTLYGNAIPSASDDRAMIKVPLIGEEGAEQAVPVPRSVLVGIIRPRLEEILELVRGRLDARGFDRVAGPRVILTGGASQLPGLRELAAQVLDKQVRLGRPKPIEGLAEAVSGPAFSTAAGLLAFAINESAEAPLGAYRPLEEPIGRLGRIGQWIRENF